jgi:hypothetical protein
MPVVACFMREERRAPCAVVQVMLVVLDVHVHVHMHVP